jgi:hypothetical protein
MEIKTLSKPALETIDRYLNFKVGAAVCSVPYFNNKTSRSKVALRAYKGKGSPKDILDEAETVLAKNRVDLNSLSDEDLKKFLVDNNLGIECSGFAYHVLEAECQSQGFGHLKNHLAFVNCKGIFGKAVCSLRPAENCDVATFASNENSRAITLKEVQPGDIITMTNSQDVTHPGERNHILVVHEVAYNNSIPVKISYTHSAAYPEDGVYGTGIRQGYIEIVSDDHSGSEAKWVENGLEGAANHLHLRAQRSKMEVRRLKWKR